MTRARDIYYQDRDWSAVLRLAPERVRTTLAALTPSCDLKRIDAVTAVGTAGRVAAR